MVFKRDFLYFQAMTTYQKLLQHILDHGVQKSDRTGVGTLSTFGYQMRFDLSESFPLLTTKKLFLRGIIEELIWFLSGSTNIRPLVQKNVRIWNEWPFQHYLKAHDLEAKFPKYTPEWEVKMAEYIEQIRDDADFAAQWGELGPVYGYQWRNSNGVDQIQDVLDSLAQSPDSRRHIVCAWNPADIPQMQVAGLPPCHCLFQFYVAEGRLSCQLYQRSADVFLGVPFNIASYSLLTLMMAQVLGLKPGEFVHTLGDAHLYTNHLDQTREQLSRKPRPCPQMTLNPEVKNLFDFTIDDFTLTNYDPHPAIKAPIAV